MAKVEYKAEINNEIVLLRHAVRQARICIVNKLVKEAKHLRNKHGTEAQQEKNKKKADKLIAEIYALKTIKDDEISKFGILNEKELTEILQDLSSSHSLRVTARIVYYKTLHRRLLQFKDRYPDCKKYLKEEKKKSTKLKNKEKSGKAKKSSKENNSRAQKKSVRYSQDDSEDEEMCSTELPEARNNSRKRKKSLDEDGTSPKKEKLTKLVEDNALEDTVLDKQPNVVKPCSVTKEGTVKKFTEFLEEQESTKEAHTSVESPIPAGAATDQTKTVDNFFMTEDNQDYQANSVSASTSYARPHTHNTRARAFQSGERVNKQGAKSKNNASFNRKYPGERSSAARPEKRTTSRTDKRANKSNSSDAGNKEENAGLHPSWLAKRKEQEIVRQGFQGKKIVFTDD